MPRLYHLTSWHGGKKSEQCHVKQNCNLYKTVLDDGKNHTVLRDYYDQYIYDAYHFAYSDSKRTNLKKVYISDDMIKTTGNVLDTF